MSKLSNSFDIKAPQRMKDEDKKLTKARIAIEIEKIVSSSGDVGYIDAICAFCEKNNLDVEDVSSMLHKNILEKVTIEAEQLNILKVKSKKSKLPF